MNDYYIEVLGALRAERSIGATVTALARELRATSYEVEKLLMDAVIAEAPTPRKGSPPIAGEPAGAGIVGSVEGDSRLAGRAKGGAPLYRQTYEVRITLDDPDMEHLSSVWEFGTGTYGAHGSEYSIYSDSGSKLGPLLVNHRSEWWPGNRPDLGPPPRYVASATHPGVEARPFIARTVRAHSNEVDQMYDQAVARAVKGF